MTTWIEFHPWTAGAITLALVLVVIPWLFRTAKGAP